MSFGFSFFFFFFFKSHFGKLPIYLIPAPVVVIFESLCMAAALSPQLGMPKMEACVYLSCNMRSSGCTEPESSLSPLISTKDSRSPPLLLQPLLNA